MTPKELSSERSDILQRLAEDRKRRGGKANLSPEDVEFSTRQAMRLAGAEVKNLRVLSHDGYNHLASLRFTLCGQPVGERWMEWPADDWGDIPERQCPSCYRIEVKATRI